MHIITSWSCASITEKAQGRARNRQLRLRMSQELSDRQQTAARESLVQGSLMHSHVPQLHSNLRCPAIEGSSDPLLVPHQVVVSLVCGYAERLRYLQDPTKQTQVTVGGHYSLQSCLILAQNPCFLIYCNMKCYSPKPPTTTQDDTLTCIL